MSIAKSIMNKPITISQTSSISDTIRLLVDKKISRLVVPETNSIITEKDVGLLLLTDNSERTLDQIPINEVSKSLISVDQNTSIKECAQTIIENAIGSLGIKENDSIIGLITKTDLARFYSENYPGKKIVGEYTTWYYAWSYSDIPLFKVVQKMVDEKISRIILRNRNEIPEGILTFRDLFRIAIQGKLDTVVDNTDPTISVIHAKKGFLSESGFGSSNNALDIMTKKIISVNYDDDLAAASKALLENNINAVGVLSRKGSIIGILSKTDVTRALAFTS